LEKSDGLAGRCRYGRKFRSEARPTGVEGTWPTVRTTAECPNDRDPNVNG
jgi:hypothetical protein